MDPLTLIGTILIVVGLVFVVLQGLRAENVI
jgi:hypothetical protein